jgi:hypothetical protein
MSPLSGSSWTFSRPRPTADQTRTPPEVGDEAIAYRGEFTSSDGRVYQELRILVRTGRYLADPAIDDYEGDSPATSELTPLAELLVERLDNAAESEGPGLGLQVARITGEQVTTYYDYYTRRDGDEVPVEGERSSQRQSDDQLFDEAGTEESYFYVAEALPTDQDPNLVSAAVDFRRFTDDQRAADYLETAVEDWSAAMGDAYSDVEVVDDAEEFGDGSVTVSYVQDSSYGPLAGYRIWVQIGDRVAAVEVDGDPEISLSAAEDVATLQLACLEDEGCVEPIATAELTQTGSGVSAEDTPEAEADETPQDEDNETPQAEEDNT